MNDIVLRALLEQDVTESYVNWMNNYDIVKYTESRFSLHTIESIKAFVRTAQSSSSILYGIFDGDKHIGNIKLGNINYIHKTADIGIIIGDSQYWGKGVATVAIKKVMTHAFLCMGLRKIMAGIYNDNIGSIRAFEKSGFSLSYIKKDECFFEGDYTDVTVYTIYYKDWKIINKT